MDTVQGYFNSTVFNGAKWSLVERAAPPAGVPLGNKKAAYWAELAWFELGHLENGQFVRLTGSYEATFYKVEQGNALVCVLQDGASGVYRHLNDETWDRRRALMASIIQAIENGELNLEAIDDGT